MLPAFAMLAFAAFGAPLPLAFVLTCVVAVGVLGWASSAASSTRCSLG